MDIQDFIEELNNGDYNLINSYFGDVETFFKVLEKKGLISEMSPLDNPYQSYLIRYFLNNKKDLFVHWIQEILGDVKYENGVFYLVVSNRGDLADLFCSNGRNEVSRETIESILSGDYNHDYFYDYLTDNVYKDVIEELTKENIILMKNYILKTLDGVEIPSTTEELKTIANEQGHPSHVIVNQENIDRIFDDEETMNELLDNQLEDLKSNLYSTYGSAYNSAYEDELYEEIFNKLDEYFIGHGEFIYVPHKYKQNTQVEQFKIPINGFESIINDLTTPSTYNNLEYYGSLLGAIEDNFDCLRFWVPDYPDSRKVDKMINEYIKDYI
jgi:hypothetical protein